MQVSAPIFTIASRSHPYTVSVDDCLRDALLAEDGRECMLLVDAVVRGLYPDAFAGLVARIVEVDATEEQKSLDQLTPVVCKVIEAGFRRDYTLVVVGGGVVQDIGCFIASVLFRGVRWVLVPTTLLAQCDSCIGSKSSLNVGPYKNQLGTFYPPHAVRLAFHVLGTLPPDELRSGMGEIVKLHLVAGGAALRWLEIQLAGPWQLHMAELVVAALTIKRGFIEADEMDRGPRNLLNYGHTFGHAFESATHFGIPHGIAVTLGMLAATSFSEELDMVPSGTRARLGASLRPLYTPYEEVLLAADPDAVFRALKQDKKNVGDDIVCILTGGPGAMKKVRLSAETQVRPMLLRFLGDLASLPTR